MNRAGLQRTRRRPVRFADAAAKSIKGNRQLRKAARGKGPRSRGLHTSRVTFLLPEGAPGVSTEQGGDSALGTWGISMTISGSSTQRDAE